MTDIEGHWPRVIVARDGSRALLLRRPTEEPYKVPGRSAAAIPLVAARVEGGELEIRVLVANILRNGLAPDWLGLPPSAKGTIHLLAEYAIGAFLDGDVPLPTDELVIECFSGAIDEMRHAEPATEEAVHNYVAWKTYWTWKFEQHWAVFNFADQLRVSRRLRQMAQIASVDDGDLWKVEGTADDGFALRPLRELMLAVRGGRIGRSYFSPLFNVGDRLSTPKYAAAAAHFRKALTFAAGTPPDRENAAKEAISVVESLVQVVFGESGTLGESVKRLRGTQRLHPALAKVLEGLWGFTSESPGVRHGSAHMPTTSDAEARLVFNLCASAVLYLTELHSK